MSFIHTINPVLLKIGFIEIRYYSLVYVVGFLAIYFLLRYYSKKKILRLTLEEAESFAVYLMLGIIIGARLFEVLVWNPLYYLRNPFDIIAVWKGGMSLHGGLIGIIIAAYFYCKKKKISFAKLADLMIIPAVFILALGRIGNFINGEIVGTITNIPWCFYFPYYEGCRHPVQLYAAFGRAVLGFVLIGLSRLKKRQGFLFWCFISLMGIGRFFCDFLREDTRLLGLSIGQYLSLAMAVIGIYVLFRYYKKFKKK